VAFFCGLGGFPPPLKWSLFVFFCLVSSFVPYQPPPTKTRGGDVVLFWQWFPCPPPRVTFLPHRCLVFSQAKTPKKKNQTNYIYQHQPQIKTQNPLKPFGGSTGFWGGGFFAVSPQKPPKQHPPSNTPNNTKITAHPALLFWGGVLPPPHPPPGQRPPCFWLVVGCFSLSPNPPFFLLFFQTKNKTKTKTPQKKPKGFGWGAPVRFYFFFFFFFFFFWGCPPPTPPHVPPPPHGVFFPFFFPQGLVFF